MRISVVLAISLSFAAPVFAQNALWGTSGNAAQSGSTGNYNNQSSGQSSGQSKSGNGRRRHRNRTQQSAPSTISGASSVKSYEDSAGSHSPSPAQTAPASTSNTNSQQQQQPASAPTQNAPAHKANGVQTY